MQHSLVIVPCFQRWLLYYCTTAVRAFLFSSMRKGIEKNLRLRYSEKSYGGSAAVIPQDHGGGKCRPNSLPPESFPIEVLVRPVADTIDAINLKEKSQGISLAGLTVRNGWRVPQISVLLYDKKKRLLI